MNSGKIVADGTGRDGWTGKSKVLQEVLADLKTALLVDDGFPKASDISGISGYHAKDAKTQAISPSSLFLV